MSPNQERLLLVTKKAEEVFGDPVAVADWMKSENPSLGGVAPGVLLDTSAGTQAVLDALGRIEHGVFS